MIYTMKYQINIRSEYMGCSINSGHIIRTVADPHNKIFYLQTCRKKTILGV